MFFSSIIINFKFSVMKKFFLVVLAMVMLGSVQAQTAFKNKVEGVTGRNSFLVRSSGLTWQVLAMV